MWAGLRPMMPEQTPSLRQLGNRLLAALPGDIFALLEPDLKQVLLPQGVVCFDPGDPINQVYFPHTGMISCLVTTGDGEMVETSSVGCEGAVGLQSGLGQRVSFTRAMVQIGGKFSVIPASRLENAASRSAALRDLIIRYTEICGQKPSKTPPAMPSTTVRRDCPGGYCNARTGSAAIN